MAAIELEFDRISTSNCDPELPLEAVCMVSCRFQAIQFETFRDDSLLEGPFEDSQRSDRQSPNIWPPKPFKLFRSKKMHLFNKNSINKNPLSDKEMKVLVEADRSWSAAQIHSHEPAIWEQPAAAGYGDEWNTIFELCMTG